MENFSSPYYQEKVSKIFSRPPHYLEKILKVFPSPLIPHYPLKISKMFMSPLIIRRRYPKVIRTCTSSGEWNPIKMITVSLLKEEFVHAQKSETKMKFFQSSNFYEKKWKILPSLKSRKKENNPSDFEHLKKKMEF